MDEALSIIQQGEQAVYQKFEEKFKTKKTTDDCYTPENVYDAIADWVAGEYHLDRANFVRPFYPGGDYKAEQYGDQAVVVDNPPFSILAEIVRFYSNAGVRFFLFAPSLTLFSARNCDCTYIVTGCDITYANGAEVATSFVTNLDDRYRIRTCPDLYGAIDKANKDNTRANKVQHPKYVYPDCVATAAAIQVISARGVELDILKSDCLRISALDQQKEYGKTIFGGGVFAV